MGSARGFSLRRSLARVWHGLTQLFALPARQRPARSLHCAEGSGASLGTDEDRAAGALDQETTLERVGGNRAMLRKLAGVFQSESAKLLSTIRTALADGDAVSLGRSAHTLKGMVRFFGAGAAAEAALRLEQLAQAGQTADAGAVLTTLTRAIEHLQEALVPLCDDATATATPSPRGPAQCPNQPPGPEATRRVVPLE